MAYVAYDWFSDFSTEELEAAKKKIEASILSFAVGGGQRTVSIGGVSFSYGSISDLERILGIINDVLNRRSATGKYAPYKLTHLMR